MPVFQILYTSPSKNHEIIESLEWVTDSDWGVERTRKCFIERHPKAELIQIREIDRPRRWRFQVG